MFNFFNKHKDREKKEEIEGKLLERPLDYYEFKKLLKDTEFNKAEGEFKKLKIGMFQVSLQPGNRRNSFCKEEERGTLAEYHDFDFSIYDSKGKIDLSKDQRFKNIPHKGYFGSIEPEKKIIIGLTETYEILLYIEQMELEADSYRNKKYFVTIDEECEKVEIVEATDEELNSLIAGRNFDKKPLKLMKYTGLYTDNSACYMVVEQEYRHKGQYRYMALYPRSLEDLVRLSIHDDIFPEEVKNNFIHVWSGLNKGRDIIYKKDWNTWHNQMEGQLFDCSANQIRFINWIRKKEGRPLALYVTLEGRVDEIYGNTEEFAMYLSSMEQNYFSNLGANGERCYTVQHYNWNPDPDYINKYVGQGRLTMYGDVIVMCVVGGKNVDITLEDLKYMFDNKLLDESLKQYLKWRMVERLEKGRVKEFSEEEYLIEKASKVTLQDGIFIFVDYNKRARLRKEKEINIYEIYKDEQKEVIDSWIAKVNNLLASNYAVGDAVIERANASDAVKRELADIKCDMEYEKFINANPGFSSETYSRAIDRGARAAM